MIFVSVVYYTFIFALMNLAYDTQQRQMKCLTHTIRYDTIEEINVDSKAEYTA